MTELINPLTLQIDKKIWHKFKLGVPRTITLNDAVVDLIKKSLIKKNETN